VQPGLCDRDGRKFMLFSNFFYEKHFPQGIARIPFGFDVDAVRDLPAGGVGVVVLDKVRLP